MSHYEGVMFSLKQYVCTDVTNSLWDKGKASNVILTVLIVSFPLYLLYL